MGSELFLILVGIVLRANGDWFGGAHEVGTICLVIGLVILIVEVLALVLVIIGGLSVAGRSRGRRRR